MEGLMLSRVLTDLHPHLPARHLGWAFPDETTAALLLDGIGNLVLSYRPPQPAFFLSQERLRGDPRNGFQRFVAARVRGELLKVEQLKLDRVVALHFAGELGFIDQPPCRLVFEVTGRNTNVLVLEAGSGFEGRILMAAREITGSRNRFRTVRSGSLYTPPPPYQKFDPRHMTVEDALTLAHVPLSQWRTHVDGLGPLLSAELARRAGLNLAEPPLDGTRQVMTALRELVQNPTVSEGTMQAGAREAARLEKAASLRKLLREPLEKRLTLLQNQLGDVQRAEEGVEQAATDRLEADLLMAYAQNVPVGAAHLTLPSFDGLAEVPIALEPQLTALQNAEKRYNRARRREDIYLRLAEREAGLREEWQAAQERLNRLEQADLTELEALAAELEGEKPEKACMECVSVALGGSRSWWAATTRRTPRSRTA